MVKKLTLESMEKLYEGIGRAWDCGNCGVALAVASWGLTCIRCGVQKRLLSIEEAGVIIKTAVESLPRRVRLDGKGRIVEEFIDSLDILKAWKAERLKS